MLQSFLYFTNNRNYGNRTIIANVQLPWRLNMLSNHSEHYKHVTKTVAFGVQKLEQQYFGVVIFRTFVPDSGTFLQIWHVNCHGQFTLKKLALSLVNKVHTNI